MKPLTTAETAQARYHTYQLLSRLYLEGLSEELLPYVSAVPSLAAEIGFALDVGSAPDFEEAAATHYHLFGLNLFPYESIFLDPAGLLGGDRSVQIAQQYQAHGYQINNDVAPDHIGHQLGFLAYLCAAEATARVTGQQGQARQLAEQQQTFLATHLSRWLPPFLVALDREEKPFYQALGSLTWEVVSDHLQGTDTSWKLLPLPDLLRDERTTLRQIASTLLSPPLSGIFISREAIGRLGRGHNLPRGFGSRQQILLNLMRSAAQYDQFPAVMFALQQEAGRWVEAYAAYKDTSSVVARTVTVWQERVAETGRMLARLAEQADTPA